MNETASLRNHFLIAMPTLEDPNFFRSVTYICEHDANGAFGIVINQPLEITLREVVEHMEVTPAAGLALDQPVYRGGPVDVERGFVLHPHGARYAATMDIGDEIALTASSDILAALAQGQGPERFLLALGYAGWGAGQLEQELADNAWLSGPADAAVLFDGPVETRWQRAAALLGVDITRISGEVGHA